MIALPLLLPLTPHCPNPPFFMLQLCEHRLQLTIPSPVSEKKRGEGREKE
jgi:hypothetical protein